MNDAMGDEAVIERRAPRRGRPKGRTAGKKPPVVHAEPAVTRQAPRPPSRPESARDMARETTRRGAVVAVGRDGEKLTRRHNAISDRFEIPESEIPPGWKYQWNTVTVLNRKLEEIEQGNLGMHRNGWRPVPASRHPGRWAPPGYEGSIIMDGLRLEERPLQLSEEASAEDTARAKALIRDRTDALRMTQRQLPGSEVARRRGHVGGPQMGMRMSIDEGLDIPAPTHQIDDGSFED